jgi:branched-chain amino acid transport system permease protein
MSLIEVRDTKINVDIHPQKAPEDTIFIHGNLGANIWWKPSLENWNHKGPGRWIFFEWRGCGSSEAPKSLKQLEMKELAKDVIGAAEVLSSEEYGAHALNADSLQQETQKTGESTSKIRKYNLVGHSTGGLIALLAVIQAPERFNKVVLLDSVGATGAELKPEILGAFDLMKVNKEVLSQVMASTIKNVDTQSAVFKEIVDKAFAMADINWKGVLENLSGLDIRDHLSRVYQPILVLHGDEDPILPIEDSKHLAEDLPSAEFKSLPGHGHSLNVEDPKKFNDIIFKFLYSSEV